MLHRSVMIFFSCSEILQALVNKGLDDGTSQDDHLCPAFTGPSVTKKNVSNVMIRAVFKKMLMNL